MKQKINPTMIKYRILIICVFAALLHANARAQQPGIDGILAEIEANNPELRALEAETEAQAAGNLAESAMAGPEIEFAYLFGPEEIGARHDFAVNQSFDCAALSGRRKSEARQKNDLLALQLRTARKEILTSARKLICEIIARNMLISEYTLRTERAAVVEELYKKGVESGEFSVSDYRKAAVDLAEAEGNLELMEAERRSLLAELTMLNGGKEVDIQEASFGLQPLPETFEEWFGQAGEDNSTMAYARAATSLNETQLKLSRAERLPSFSVGYMAELIPGEEFRGVKLGVSIPLWSSGKRTAEARKRLEAARISESMTASRFRIKAESLYDNAVRLRKAADKYNALADLNDCRADLEKALASGGISLLEYIGELSFFYDTIELAIDTEKRYNLAVADLAAMEM